MSQLTEDEQVAAYAKVAQDAFASALVSAGERYDAAVTARDHAFEFGDGHQCMKSPGVWVSSVDPPTVEEVRNAVPPPAAARSHVPCETTAPLASSPLWGMEERVAKLVADEVAFTAVRCECLARARGDLVTAADIRREFPKAFPATTATAHDPATCWHCLHEKTGDNRA